MAPIISTFGSGSARGFGRGGIANFILNFTANATLYGAMGPTSINDINLTDNSDTPLSVSMNGSRNGYFQFTIPAGTYNITVDGASGVQDSSGAVFGRPARMSGDYTFSSATPLIFLLGQPAFRDPTAGVGDNTGAGGTFLAIGSDISSAIPLAVAGGSSTSIGTYSNADASLNTSGNSGVGGSNPNTGGTDGGGGAVGCGFGAAGFYGNGNEARNGDAVNSSDRSCVGFSTSYTYASSLPNDKRNSGAFINGGQGSIGYETSTPSQGGFGGGAGTGNNGIGGGGGYSGGGSTYSSSESGGGGGSFQASGFTNINNTLLAQNSLRFGRIQISTKE